MSQQPVSLQWDHFHAGHRLVEGSLGDGATWLLHPQRQGGIEGGGQGGGAEQAQLLPLSCALVGMEERSSCDLLDLI